MTQIPALRHTRGAVVVDARELEHAPTALVHFGIAPDGLPWLLDVDRSNRMRNLFSAVLSSFGLSTLDELPDSVRSAVEQDVAAGLMGVHEVELPGTGTKSAYVTRRSALQICGRTLLSQILESKPRRYEAPEPDHMIARTNTAAYNPEELERAIIESQSGRQLMVTLEGDSWIGTVRPDDKALRTPTGPFRRAVFESLAALPGTVASVSAQTGETWRAPVADPGEYLGVLTRASETFNGGWVSYQVQRSAVLGVLCGVAEMIGERHARGLVHADLSPGNVLIDNGKPVSFDGLDIEIGNVAQAGTFDWSAPESIVGKPLDPRADVYALGKMLCALVGGVPYGEVVEYVVPTGGADSETVEMLKTDGVFVDILNTSYSRQWQSKWQELLGRCLAYDPERRPRDGAELARQLSGLAHRFPVEGEIELDGEFGAIVALQRPNTWAFARTIGDG